MRPTLLLSVDFEDWHQLVRRRVGAGHWEQAGPALARETRSLLGLLDELRVKATFFILGMAARAHPDLVELIVQRGHEIGCHGDAHLPVHRQQPDEFADDLRAARATIERLTGCKPIGYRAPAFSLPPEARWAHHVLAQEGFAYDSSHHDSLPLSGRAHGDTGPRRLRLGPDESLWELPVAVWRGRRLCLPVGGASYWALTPMALVLEGLNRAGMFAGLYLHPHEFDPQPLDVQLPPGQPISRRTHAALRAMQRNAARRRAPQVLRAIASRFELIPYCEGYDRLSGAIAAGT